MLKISSKSVNAAINYKRIQMPKMQSFTTFSIYILCIHISSMYRAWLIKCYKLSPLADINTEIFSCKMVNNDKYNEQNGEEGLTF